MKYISLFSSCVLLFSHISFCSDGPKTMPLADAFKVSYAEVGDYKFTCNSSGIPDRQALFFLAQTKLNDTGLYFHDNFLNNAMKAIADLGPEYQTVSNALCKSIQKTFKDYNDKFPKNLSDVNSQFLSIALIHVMNKKSPTSPLPMKDPKYAVFGFYNDAEQDAEENVYGIDDYNTFNEEKRFTNGTVSSTSKPYTSTTMINLNTIFYKSFVEQNRLQDYANAVRKAPLPDELVPFNVNHAIYPRGVLAVDIAKTLALLSEQVDKSSS